MKVAVVGAGIMGLSAAWALARSGHEVDLFDQAPVPNPKGSSVDQHRLIRYPYGSQAGYTLMVAEAYEAWERLWEDLGERLYVSTGTLVLATAAEGWARESAATLEELGTSVRWIPPGEIESRFPPLTSEGVSCAFHLESGGVLLAERIVSALALHLLRRGVRLEAETRVADVDAERSRVVLAGGRTVSADALIVAAGAWATRLVPDLGARVTPSRQVVVYLDPPADRRTQWAASPMVLDIDPEAGFYLVPPVLGTSLKLGDHRFSLAGDPEEGREVAEAEARAVLELCRPRLRDFEGYRLAGARSCFYTVEPEERFIVEPRGRAWVVSACSGHGFKFGPLLGLALAEAVEGRRDPPSLARWAAGETL